MYNEIYAARNKAISDQNMGLPYFHMTGAAINADASGTIQ
jgi:hypothetical protein